MSDSQLVTAGPRLRRRQFKITQGRLYSTVIVVAVAALLLPNLTHWRPASALKPLSGVTFQKRAPVTAAPSVAPPGAPATSPTGGGLPSGLNGFSLGSGSTFPITGSGTVGGTLTPITLTTPVQTSVPTSPTCQAAVLNATATALLNKLNASLKILPTATVETALGLATGCNNANPALLAVGALSEVGDDLSTLFKEVPGASALKFPKVPALNLPPAFLPLLATLKPVFAPVCGEINTAANIVILIAPHYPQVIDGASALALFQSAVTCAELTGAG